MINFSLEKMNAFQLYMFDLDGLLVDTEKAHYEAYRTMCQNRDVKLSWDFPAYCTHAHYSSEGIHTGLLKDHPELFETEKNWEVFYNEKTKAILDLYEKGSIPLLPGVEKLLNTLRKKNIQHCVVTHSSEKLVSLLRKKHQILDSIPHWIMREDYSNPKPDPECYKVAMKRLLCKGGRAVGFEDTIRGLKALVGSGAEAFLVTTMNYPEIPEVISHGVRHLQSFEEFNNLNFEFFNI